MENNMIGVQVHQYRIHRSLGRGGMGEVYLAEDSILKREVALKFLGDEYLENKTFRARFHREAQAAAKLTHPNVVTVFESGEWNNRPFISMRYVEGVSLGSFLQSAHVSLSEKFRLAVAIAEGLNAAHLAGIVHRDLKPSNIMLDNQRCPILLDFGLAKLVGVPSVTSRNLRLGTLAYMSPEQTRGEPVDHRSDIFSLGVILYEMFTAHQPFTGEYEPAILYAIAFETQKSMTEHISDSPTGLQRVIDQALMKSPSDRYQQMEDMLADLKLLEIGQEPEVAASENQQARREAPSLAALYLKNLGPQEDEFLSYGLTEDLIVDLTRLGSVRVPPMRASLTHKDSPDDIKVIGDKLGVKFALDGSIHRKGDSVRISAQLIEISTGTNLWAQRWEEPLGNLPAIKEEIVRQVAENLQIGQVKKARAESDASIESPHAYEFYLRGRFAFDHKQEESDVAVATGFFKQAATEEPALLAARCGIAESLIHQGNYGEATVELTATLAEARRRGARSSEATILRLLAQTLERRSRWDESRKYALEALAVSRDIENYNEEVEALSTLIQLSLRRADLDSALIHYQRALEISRILGDENKVAEALRKMGNVYMRKGEVGRALSLYDSSLEIAEKQKNSSMQANCISNQGLAHYQLGDFQLARKLSQEALKLRRNLGDHAGEATSLNILALIDYSHGRYHQAISQFEESARICERLGDKGDLALSRNNIANMQAILGDYGSAQEGAEAALQTALLLNYPLIEIGATRTLGVVSLRQGDYSAANELLQVALKKSREVELAGENAATLTELAEMQFQQGNFVQAKAYASEGLAQAKDTNEPTEEIKAVAFVQAVDAITGDFGVAIDSLRETLCRADDYGDPRIVTHVQRLLGQVLISQGGADSEDSDGVKILTEALSRSQDLQIAYEEKWIGELLARTAHK
jgi:serine/threonine protein kinase/Tfp pilus assembly protein PilF